MKRIYILILVLLFCIAGMTGYTYSAPENTGIEQRNIQQSNRGATSSKTTYPEDINSQEIADGEYEEEIDIEQMYRDMPVPTFKYMHNIDPGEYQDTMYSTWSPYPLFRLTAPLFFKSIKIEPGYYLLTPREYKDAWYMLFKEAGRVKYIVPCYKREVVPMDFYKNHLPQVKMTKPQTIREKALRFIGKKYDSAKRKPIPDTYLEADDKDNNFISLIVYWGYYRYYFVLRTIQL